MIGAINASSPADVYGQFGMAVEPDLEGFKEAVRRYQEQYLPPHLRFEPVPVGSLSELMSQLEKASAALEFFEVDDVSAMTNENAAQMDDQAQKLADRLFGELVNAIV